MERLRRRRLVFVAVWAAMTTKMPMDAAAAVDDLPHAACSVLSGGLFEGIIDTHFSQGSLFVVSSVALLRGMSNCMLVCLP
jgi:hypothetical protein